MICNQMASYTKRKGKETQLEIIGGEGNELTNWPFDFYLNINFIQINTWLFVENAISMILKLKTAKMILSWQI